MPVIKVEDLSKRYNIGRGLPVYDTLRDRITGLVEKPFNLLRANHSVPKRHSSEVWALNKVSFEVQAGEVVGVVGLNGSGKSTLLKILSRITYPTSGSAKIRGRTASLLEVGTGFHPELSGRENVYLNGAILGMSRSEIDARFDEIVAFAEVEEFLNTPVKRYSTGMYLRLAFAIAAHLRTEMLFIDEVLAVGDIEFQRKCLGKVEGAARDGRTVLVVSHNLGVITELCQRALLLNRGVLELDGPAREVVLAYCSRWQEPAHHWKRADQNGDSGDKEILLLSVQLRQEGTNHNNVFTFDCGFNAEIEYELKKPTTDARVVLRIVSDTGTIIFTSSDQDKPSTTAMRVEGRYRSVCRIPGNLLRSGRFYLTVATRHHGNWVEVYDNLLAFEISSIGNPLPNRLGVISPVLDWDIHKLN